MKVLLMILLVSFLLLLSATRVTKAEEVSGYLIDKQCELLCINKTADEICTPDKVNVFYNPQGHTGWCLLLQSCVDSGYVLMSEFPDEVTGMHSVVLDLNNNVSFPSVLAYITAGTTGMFPLVTVEYNETAAQEIDGVTHVYGVTIRDTWDDSRYGGESTHQVVCPDSTSPDLSKNNMCFRSDVIVANAMNDMYLIESNGCPDHVSMQGSSGIVANSQEGADAGSDDGGSSTTCGGGCSATCGGGCSATCGGGGCGSCGSCSSSTGCNGGSCCSSSTGCDGGNKTDVCNGGTNMTTGGLCDGGNTTVAINGARTRQLQCSAGCCSASAGCCSASTGCCGATSSKNSTCGACCSGAGCGACGGGCGTTATNGCHGHASTTGTYDPMFQHYRAFIPMNPGEPGDEELHFSGKDDEVVGIMSNGVVLESHKPTWSYDSCNGHSDTKHMYHYHIPPSCFLQAMGVTYPEETFWWKSGDAVRTYSDMGAQWPATGPPSPVIGFALDGYPIFGPYDDAGKVQHGMDYPGSELDACNGKKDSKGNYGYYLTVDPPFAPICLKGTNKGYFSYMTTDKACPRDGIETNVMAVTSGGACESVDFASILSCAEENPSAVSTPSAVEETTAEETTSGSSNCLVGSTAAAAMAAGVAATAALL